MQRAQVKVVQLPLTLLRTSTRPSVALPKRQRHCNYATHAPANPSRSTAAIDAGAPPRTYTARKTHLHAQYASLLASPSSVHLLLSHANFSVAQLTKLRRDIAAIRVPTGDASTSPDAAAAPSSFLIIRPGIFSAALRTQPPLSSALPTLLPLLTGPVALVSLPTLHPPALASLIRILDRAAPKAPPKAQNQNKGEKSAEEPKRPELNLVGAIVSSQLLLPPAVRDTSKLPSLDTLRAQIVGLISAPAASLVGVLGRARGGGLVSLLEGLKKSLEEKEAPPP